MMTTGGAKAQTWIGTTGSWTDSTQWTGGAYPNSTIADVIINGGASVTLSNLLPLSMRSLTLASTAGLAVNSTESAYGNLTDNGNLSIGGFLSFESAGTVSLNGTGVITLANANATISSKGKPTIIASTLTIHGQGTVQTVNSGRIVNNGTITADVPGGTLKFAGSSMTNAGSLSAINGGILDVGDPFFNTASWTNKGTISVDATSTVVFANTFGKASIGTFIRQPTSTVILAGIYTNTAQVLDLGTTFGSLTIGNGTISGGTVNTSLGATLSIAGALFDGVTLNVKPDFSSSNSQLNVTHGLTLGNVALDLSVGNFAGGRLVFSGTAAQTLGGTGTVFLGSLAGAARITVPASGPLTIGPNILMRGAANITGPFVNQGTIIADVSNLSLDNPVLSITNITNQANISVTNGASLILAGAWHNSGTITVADNSSLTLKGDFIPADIGKIVHGANNPILLNSVLNLGGGTFDLGTTLGSTIFQGGTLRNGTITASGGAKLQFDLRSYQNSTLDGVSLGTSPEFIGSYSQVIITNGLKLNGITLDLSGGTNQNQGLTVNFQSVAAQTLGGSGQVLLGSNTANALSAGGAGPLTIGSGILVHGQGGLYGSVINQGTVTADVNGGSINLNKMTNTGTFQINAGSSVSLYGIAPLVMQNDGRLIVNGLLDVTNSGLMQNGTLTGSGTITGTVLVGAISSPPASSRFASASPAPAGGSSVSPGTTADGLNSLGTMTLAGNVTLGSGAHYLAEISGSGSSDLLNILAGGTSAGNLTIGAGSYLDVQPLGAFSPGSSFIVASYTGALSGTFENITPNFAVSYATPNEIIVTAVPEPSIMGACALGIIATLRRRRKPATIISESGN